MALLESLLGLGGHASSRLILGLGLGALLIYSLLHATYNVFFHPLRRLPGPLLWRASRLPWFYHTVMGTIHDRVQRFHDEYGTAVRVAPNNVSFTDASAINAIYGHRVGALAKVPETRKAGFVHAIYRVLEGGGALEILHAEGEDHQRLRRALAHGFSEKGLREQQPLVQGYVDMMMRQLHRLCQKGGEKQRINLELWARMATNDIVGDLSMGQSLKMLESGKLHPWAASASTGSQLLTTVGAIDFVGLWWLLEAVVSRSSVRQKTMTKLAAVREMVDQRVKLGSRVDLMEGLVKRQDEFDMDVIVSNAQTLFGAGSDTTAIALTGVLYNLLAHPAALARLKKEVRSKFAHGSEITISTVVQLNYMLACIQESLRMYPAVASGNIRETTDTQTIAGWTLPAGTFVEVMQWCSNHDPHNWSDPWTYKPERFIIKEDEHGNVLETYQPFLKAEYREETNQNGDRVETLQPFVTGPRNCLGRSLAYTELRLITARLVCEFDLEFAPGFQKEDWISQQRAYSSWHTKPVWAHLTPVPGRGEGSAFVKGES